MSTSIHQMILVCGDRNWTNRERMISILSQFKHQNITIVEGEAIGADLMAREVCLDMGIDVIGVPANWNRYHRAAGPIRNAKMLDISFQNKSLTLIIAFHNDIKNSKGTKNMINQALDRNLQIMLVTDTTEMHITEKLE